MNIISIHRFVRFADDIVAALWRGRVAVVDIGHNVARTLSQVNFQLSWYQWSYNRLENLLGRRRLMRGLRVGACGLLGLTVIYIAYRDGLPSYIGNALQSSINHMLPPDEGTIGTRLVRVGLHLLDSNLAWNNFFEPDLDTMFFAYSFRDLFAIYRSMR